MSTDQRNDPAQADLADSVGFIGITYGSMGDRKAVVAPKKLTSAWVVTHDSCIPACPSQCAGRSTGLSSSLPLFTIFITLGRGLVNSELF